MCEDKVSLIIECIVSAFDRGNFSCSVLESHRNLIMRVEKGTCGAVRRLLR